MSLKKYDDYYDDWGLPRAKPRVRRDPDDYEEEEDDEDSLGGQIRAPNMLRGLAPAFMTNASEAANRPATDPLQWKVYFERYGFMIYETPTEEFCKNTHILNRETLHYRWKGLGVEEEIERLFGNYQLAYAQRAKTQDLLKREMSLPDMKDPERLEIELRHRIKEVEDRMAYIKFRLDEGIEIKVEEYYRLLGGGTRIEENIRPLSELSRSRLDRDYRNYADLWLDLTGQKVKKSEHKIDVGESIRDIMAKVLNAGGHRAPSGHTLSELQGLAFPSKQLPPSSVIEAQVTEIPEFEKQEVK